MTPRAGPPTILIVDDTPSNLGVLVQLFENRGYRVSIAQDGEEGLQRAQLLRPDLILLDAMMPGPDGFETCRRLKAEASTGDIPVIFMTALAMPEHKVKGLQAGAVDYVTKPLQIDEIIARVDTHLKLHAAQRQLEEQNAQLDRHLEELERRVAERTFELAARESEFRTLVENSPDEIARHDRQCRYFYINPQHEKTLGMSIGHIAGKTPMELFPGKSDVAAYQALMTEVIETGRPAECEATLPDEGEGQRHHYIRLVAERDADGEIVGVLAIGRDITALRRAESELYLRNRALDTSFDATYLVDTELRFRYVNEAAVRVLGYSREELMSLSLLDIDPNVSREAVLELMRRTADKGRFPGTVESVHRRKNGETFPIEVGATTFSYGGEVLFLTTVRDITERKRMEERLLASEQEFRTLAENAPDIIMRYDRDCRRVYVNPAYEREIGITRKRALGVSPDGQWPSGVTMPVEEYMAHLRQVAETGEPEEVFVGWPLPGGGMRYYAVLIVAERNHEGAVMGVLTMGRNVTGLLETERYLKESRAQLRELAARRDQAREEERKRIARELHDELGQHLTALSLKVSALDIEFGGAVPKLGEKLRSLAELADATKQVVRNVSAALRPAALDMGLVPAVEWLADEFTRRSGIPCALRLQEEEVTLDDMGIIVAFRVVQESLTNIARHAEASDVTISMGREGNQYVLEIQDDGRGFDIDAANRKTFGLIGMRERLLMMAGCFDIVSVPGRGTVVRACIPAKE